MKNSDKYLGINQPIPFPVLDEVIFNLINDTPLSDLNIRSLLLEFNQGENRIKKAVSHISTISEKASSIIKVFQRAATPEHYINLTISDRKCFAFDLMAITYPVTYRFITVLAQGFKVQPRINKEYILRKMVMQYGSNRGIVNALGALIPMSLEVGIINRPIKAVYESSETWHILNPLVKEIHIFADILLSGSKSILVEDLPYRPWQYFFSAASPLMPKLKIIQSQSGRFGQDLITISVG